MSCASRPIPLKTAQRRELALTVTGGLYGFRVAFVGGPTFDVVEELPSFAEACAARRAAEHALADLGRIFAAAKGRV